MKKINIAIIILLISSLGYAQEIKPIYVDSDAPIDLNWSFDVIEDSDGNYIYTAAPYMAPFDAIGVITKVSPDGKLINKKEFYPTAEGCNFFFEWIFQPDDDTYFVTGRIDTIGASYTVFTTLDKEFNVIKQKRNWISDNRYCSPIMIRAASDGRYFVAINYGHQGDDISSTIAGINPMAFTFVLDKDWNINDIFRLDEMPCNIIPIDDGSSFMLPVPTQGYYTFDSNFKFVKYEKNSFQLISHPSDGLYFEDGHVVCFSGQHGNYNPTMKSVLRVSDIDLNENYRSSLLHKVGISEPKFVTSMPLSRGCDYVTKDNVIFGGTINASNLGTTGGWTPYCIYPSKLAIASYNRESNSVNDELFYEDGVNHYWMTSLSATKDGGGIVIATRATPEQAKVAANDIVLLKYTRKGMSVNNAEGNAAFSIYPNPAVNEIKLNSDVIGEKTVILYDTTGRIAKQITITEAEITVDISDLHKGIYLVKLSNSNNTQKLIVK